ncbi:MAG: hypothetical protein O9342_16365 [Beijerinckiaceae bacterium]|nr:hypothetical protein [Beijerinckiaceae bacterium]
MTDQDQPPAPELVDSDEEESGQNGQPGSKIDILGHAVGDAVGEVCAAGLDLAGSILGGVLDGI